MKKKLVTIAVCGIISSGFMSGCTSKPTKTFSDAAYKHQIVYRDLTKSESYNSYSGPVIRTNTFNNPSMATQVQKKNPVVPVEKAKIKSPHSPEVIQLLRELKDMKAPELELYRSVVKNVSTPKKQVDFANESARLADLLAVDDIVKNIKENQHVVLIGHSHGKSSVGVEKLSTSRANEMAKALVKAGISRDRIHTMASWSNAKEAHAPAKGVQVFITNGKDDQKLFLQLSKL